MTFLLPRLPGPACDVIVRRFLEHGPSAWAGFRPDALPDQVRFAATGGAPVPPASLATVRQDLVAIARKHGFGQQGARQSHAGFDAETAAWLARSDLFTTGEALRDDVWAFVAAFIARTSPTGASAARQSATPEVCAIPSKGSGCVAVHSIGGRGMPSVGDYWRR